MGEMLERLLSRRILETTAKVVFLQVTARTFFERPLLPNLPFSLKVSCMRRSAWAVLGKDGANGTEERRGLSCDEGGLCDFPALDSGPDHCLLPGLPLEQPQWRPCTCLPSVSPHLVGCNARRKCISSAKCDDQSVAKCSGGGGDIGPHCWQNDGDHL